jgi:hypothetical protein
VLARKGGENLALLAKRGGPRRKFFGRWSRRRGSAGRQRLQQAFRFGRLDPASAPCCIASCQRGDVVHELGRGPRAVAQLDHHRGCGVQAVQVRTVDVVGEVPVVTRRKRHERVSENAMIWKHVRKNKNAGEHDHIPRHRTNIALGSGMNEL